MPLNRSEELTGGFMDWCKSSKQKMMIEVAKESWSARKGETKGYYVPQSPVAHYKAIKEFMRDYNAH